MATKHAVLSASSSERWLNCPPSARLCEAYEDKGSDYAAEGTDAHALCEFRLKQALGIPADNPIENLSWYNEEMEDCAAVYAAYVTELLETAKQTCTDSVILIEQRVDFSRWVQDGFGTADCIVIADGELNIVDYKHGKGVEVSAVDNPQMMLYALGALEIFDGIYDIDTVRMTIYQPRKSNISVCVMEKDGLLEWAQNDLTYKAKLAYEGGDYYTRLEKLPYELMPGEVGTVRESIFLERAIVGERIRLAMGLPLRDVSEHTLLSDGVEESAIAEKYYDPPLINIIKYACHACPDTHYEVTNACQGCLARHCSHACPKGAIYFEHGQAHIDQTKCIKCGKCKAACSYQAIIKFFRPCQEACGMDAIGKDEHGRAQINYDKCVNCGMCLVNCPFGAIVDKGQLFQLIHAIRGGDKVIAIIAPAFWGQFGEKVTPGQIKAAMKQLGFAGLEEVAVGADLCAIEEAEEFLRVVPEKQPFMATSCCPAWSVMAKKEFPGFAPYISMTMTPMVLTARLQKRRNPGCKIAFIGPCAAKKLEASRRSVRSDVDFVLTFEELRGMFEAKSIDFSQIPDQEAQYAASAPGVGFAASGGVAKAVEEVIEKLEPGRQVKTVYAEGLRECRQMLRMARTGKYNGYLLEGMACPGGCIAGAGTVQPPEKSRRLLEQYKAKAPKSNPADSDYTEYLDIICEDEQSWDPVARH